MINALDLISLFIGVLGVFYSANGLRGLLIRRNAKVAAMLTDPLGRLDFLFSEGQFDLIFKWVYEDLAIALGAFFLLFSLVLSSTANLCSTCLIGIDSISLQVLLRVGAVCLGIFLGWCTLPLLRKHAVEYSAREIERMAADWVRNRPNEKQRIKKMLNNWFYRRVGRDPNLNC